MKKILFSLTIFFVFTTCKRASLRGDHFIFGTYYLECEGNCMNYFMLKKGELYPDDMTKRTHKLYFKNTKLPQYKVDLAKKLEENMPDMLKNSASGAYGCPDCRDQGAVYIEIKKNSTIKRFDIDTDTSQIPVEIRKYVSEVKSTLEQL